MEKPLILVVEDEPIVAKSIEDMLKSFGYTVTDVVSSGKDAIKKAAETHPDLVLMDIVLEGDIDGIKAAEQIRARFDIPVVYLTAYADDTTLQRAKLTVPYGYVIKPFRERELHAAIDLALYRRMMEREVTPSAENPELERALKELVKARGVNAAAVISKDGAMVKFCNTLTPPDISPLSSVVAMMTRMAEKCSRLLKTGDVVEITARADSGMVVTEKSGEFIFLVAVDKGFDIDAIKPRRERVREVIKGLT